MCDEKKLIEQINRKIAFANKIINNNQYNACITELFSSLEFGIKLLWIKKIGEIEHGKDSVYSMVNDERLKAFLNDFIISDINAIRRIRNDITHNALCCDNDTAKEILVRTTRCIQEIEKAIPMKILEMQPCATEDLPQDGERKFIIKYGISPEVVRPILRLNVGSRAILVYDDSVCVGVVWDHNDSKGSDAIGQAEIRFFDKYKNKYGTWHRMFIHGQRLSFARLKSEIETTGEFVYFGTPKGKTV